MGPSSARNLGFRRPPPTSKNRSKPSGAGYDANGRCEALKILGSKAPAAFKDAERHEGRSVPPVCGQYGDKPALRSLGCATTLAPLETLRQQPRPSALDSSFCVHSLAISSNVSRCASLAASSAQRRHSSALRLHSSIVSMLAPRCDSRATRSLTICSWATDRTALLPATRRPSHPVWLNRRSANCAMDQTKTGLSLVALRREVNGAAYSAECNSARAGVQEVDHLLRSGKQSSGVYPKRCEITPAIKCLNRSSVLRARYVLLELIRD